MDVFFVLVEPAVPENIGASARAIKTMGFKNLRMVNPAPYLDGKAKWVAHGSWDILENAMVYNDLKTALSDMDLVIGTTAKNRIVVGEYFLCNKLPEMLSEKMDLVKSVAVVFGREESGLTNEELSLCNMVSTIPIANPYPSLNLSQAVMLYCYTLFGLNKTTNEEVATNDISEKVSMPALLNKVRIILDIAEINSRPALYHRILERIQTIRGKDVNYLLSVCNGLLKKIQHK